MARALVSGSSQSLNNPVGQLPEFTRRRSHRLHSESESLVDVLLLWLVFHLKLILRLTTRSVGRMWLVDHGGVLRPTIVSLRISIVD